MLSSLELIQATGVSRATLNNYIAQGLIPRPVVQKPDENSASRARQMGFFPEETIPCIKHIQQLKKEGKSMAEIISLLQSTDSKPSSKPAESPVQTTTQASTGELHLTIDKIPYAAYIVNYKF